MLLTSSLHLPRQRVSLGDHACHGGCASSLLLTLGPASVLRAGADGGVARTSGGRAKCC